MHPLSTPTIDAMYRRTRIRMHVAMARRYASRGRLTRATSLLHDALEMLPDGVMLHNILGNVYLQGNRLDKALESFSTAIDIRPDFALPYHNIALVHHRQGDNAAARRYCDKALARNPYFTPAREFRAFLTHR
jgi:Tfp pilus assembly protein PilF